MAKTYKSVSIDMDNYEFLQAKAAKLTDETGVNHSVNDVISVLRKKDEEEQ